MIKKTLLTIAFLLLITQNVSAQTKKIEVFEIAKGKVIKEVPINREIQMEIEHYLKEISGVYQKVKPIPSAGIMIKIPLDPVVRVENQWLTQFIDEVIIILPADGNPVLMIPDEKRVLFFTFKGKIEPLLKMLNVQK